MNRAQLTEPERLAELEAEVACRILRIQQSGAWVIVEDGPNSETLDTLRLAEVGIKGRQYPIVLSLRTDKIFSTTSQMRLLRVPSGWLVDQLGSEILVALDPHVLPGVRIRIGSVRPSIDLGNP